MLRHQDVPLPGGRTIRAYDTGGEDAFTVVWHHGSPQTGAPPEPLLAATAERGVRLVSYARPSYGGSTPQPDRTVAAAAADTARVADALGVARFAVMGASGGGPHALACVALLRGRATAAASLAGLAPPTRDFDWFAGMASPGGLRSAMKGRAARAAYAETDGFDPASFTPADWEALAGAWAWLGDDAQRAGAAGPDGLIDDDVAFTAAWCFDVTRIEAPVLVVQGGEDRVVPPAHAEWLARHCPRSELWLRPRAGHVSILDACPPAIDWLRARADRR
ncbi:MAG TPA: alpha/beta hydrolase [Solirubrobacteraceae bacterium]|nr:alpha/beta hydrolase [Solirubrobacteraceae bacterium]